MRLERLRRSARYAPPLLPLDILEALALAPQLGSIDQIGRKPPHKEHGTDQHGRLDIHLDIAPKVQCDVVPVSAGEDREENRGHDPEQGLQELHWTGL
jgi:hypothetical protein